MKIGYYILTDIQHIPPIMRIYERLGGTIMTKNKRIYEYINENYAHLNPTVFLVDHTYKAMNIARKSGLKVIVYTGFQMIYWGYAVQVFHGVSDKRYVEDKRMRLFDRIFLPGQKTKDKIENAGYVKNLDKLVLIGYPKFDDVINNKAARAPLFDNGKPTVLYAPTWISAGAIDMKFSAYGESSLPLWGKRLVKAIAPRWNLIIKYHSRLNEDMTGIYGEIEDYIKRLGVEKNVKTVWDADISVYMRQADIMISDISAVCYEWFHFDRPIIFANPSPENYRPSEDKFSNTFVWRAGDVLYKEDDIIPAIERNLESDNYRKIRGELLHYAFHKPDGKATDRQVEAIEEFYEKVKSHGKLRIALFNLLKVIGIYKRV